MIVEKMNVEEIVEIVKAKGYFKVSCGRWGYIAIRYKSHDTRPTVFRSYPPPYAEEGWQRWFDTVEEATAFFVSVASKWLVDP